MIGGIFGTIGKKLGIGKEKYFLELDDAAGKSVENLKGAATKATKVAKEAASDIADKAQELAGEAQEFAGEAADKAQDAIATGQTKAKAAGRFGKKAVASDKDAKKDAGKDAKKDAKSAPKGARRQKGKSKNAVAVAEPAIAQKTVAAAPAAPRDPEDIIRAAITAGTQQTDSSGNVINAAQNFATDFLMPQANSSRRRPGPSLSPFKSMAKAVNPRLKG